MNSIELSIPQYEFLSSEADFAAMVAGYGAGKSFSGACSLLSPIIAHPGIQNGYFGPTYAQIRDIFYPTIENVAELFGLRIDIKKSDKEVIIKSKKRAYGKIICRSMDKPETIVGFEIARALLDEFDTLPTHKGILVWRKVHGRCRLKVPGLKNGIRITTTPEGFRATYQIFVKDLETKPHLKRNYQIIHASTESNRIHLPEEYIQNLYDAYPAECVSAYINGQFTNLTSGTIYRNYDRERCNSNEAITEAVPEKRLPGEPLYIGQDFNVGNMHSCVCVGRGNEFHAVAELKGLIDTPDTIRAIRERWPSHQIYIYPDASGKNRKSSCASETDLALLRQAGFIVRVNPRNPSVKDRILSVNKVLEDGRLKVNYRACPKTAECLERQAYDDNGEPDKSSGFDHMNEALGYLVAWEMPINKPRLTVQGA